MAIRGLPMPINEVLGVWREIEGKALQPCTLAILAADEGLRGRWQRELAHGSAYPDLLVPVGPEGPDERLLGDDVIAMALVGKASGSIRQELPALGRFPRERVLVLLVGIAEHLAAGRQREAMNALGLKAEQVLRVASDVDIPKRLPQRLFTLFPDSVIPLARQFPVFREEAAWQEVEATAKQNAVVGLIPVPGGDMPIMTANQIKMILRMAAAYDLPLTSQRAKELFAVVGGGFAFRTLARQLCKFVPGPGWLVGGSIGYSGTLAMGKTAIEYFRRVAPSAPARPLAVSS